MTVRSSPAPLGKGPQAPYPPGSRLASWLLTSVLIGWFIAYNVLRVLGRSPRGAAWVALAIGVALGLGLFALTVVVWRRFVATGRVRAHHIDIPPPERLAPQQRAALRVAAPLVGILAGIALVVGVALAVGWYQTEGERSATKVILAAWNLLIGGWLAAESPELWRGQAEGVESIALACILTAVLGGVALSRNMFEVGQIALIVAAGLAGAVTYHAGWRLAGARRVPLGMLGALAVSALALALPLVS